MHDEQGSSNAGDARGPVWRKVRGVDRRLDAGQTGGSTREGEGRQDGFSSFLHRCAVWAPFDERTHLHTRAGPRGKEPPLLLALPVLSRARDALAHRWSWRSSRRQAAVVTQGGLRSDIGGRTVTFSCNNPGVPARSAAGSLVLGDALRWPAPTVRIVGYRDRYPVALGPRSCHSPGSSLSQLPALTAGSWSMCHRNRTPSRANA
jgi:hypothetical protein